MTLPLALYSEPWKILTLVTDSIDFPSMGLMTLLLQTQILHEYTCPYTLISLQDLESNIFYIGCLDGMCTQR